MKKFFRQLSFRRKLLISFVTLSCIPVLLVGIAAYHLYTNFIINMTEKSSIETIDLVCDDIDSLLNDAWTLCDMLTGDIKIQKYLRMDFDSIRDQYSNDLAGNDIPSVGYATVYPLTMFLRVLSAQLLILFLA